MRRPRKRYWLLLTLLLLTLIAWLSCRPTTEANRLVANRGAQTAERRSVVIRGRVSNYDGKNAGLALIFSQPGVARTRVPVAIDSGGRFEHAFSAYQPLDAKLLETKTLANIDFIYHPGDTIELQFEAAGDHLAVLRSASFHDNRSETNNDLLRFQVQKHERDLGYGKNSDPYETAKLNLDDLRVRMQQLREKQATLLKAFCAESDATDEAKAWASLYAFDTYYYLLDQYAADNETPEDYYSYYDTLSPLDDRSMLCWGVLNSRAATWSRRLKHDLFGGYLGAASSFLGNPDKQFIEYAQERIADERMKQLAIAHRYASLFAVGEVRGFEANADLLSEAISDPRIYQPLYDSYRRAKERLEEPLADADAVLERLEGATLAETVSRVLAKNQGKVVYLDCWSTWCVPCLEAMPHVEELMDKAGHEGIAYVFLCVRSDPDVWKRVSARFDYQRAQHLLLDQEQSEFFAETMGIDGYPYYFLIDKQGRIAEQGGHLHPREERTAQRLVDLAGKP